MFLTILAIDFINYIIFLYIFYLIFLYFNNFINLIYNSETNSEKDLLIRDAVISEILRIYMDGITKKCFLFSGSASLFIIRTISLLISLGNLDANSFSC